LYEITDIFVEINRDKYTNLEGIAPKELDDEVKRYISNRTSEECVWKLGKTNTITLLQCRNCRKYFSEEYCKPVKPHFGICDTCRIIYNK